MRGGQLSDRGLDLPFECVAVFGGQFGHFSENGLDGHRRLHSAGVTDRRVNVAAADEAAEAAAGVGVTQRQVCAGESLVDR